MSHLALSNHSMNPPMSSPISNSSVARTRKSTLTQQQKNKKRQRATPAQLVVLKKEFEINNTPNAKTREEIGKKIDMTERSVQIWFQNKRAKQKLFSRKNNIYGLGNLSPLGANISNGYISGSSTSPIDDSCGSTPNGLGYTNAINKNILLSPYGGVYSVFSKPTSSLDGAADSRNMSRGCGNLSELIFFSCTSLTIGVWRRIASLNNNGLTPDELIVLYSTADEMFTYLMFDGTTRFRMEFPAKAVDNITLTVDENNPMAGIITLRLNSRPSFSVKSPKAPDRWLVCGDFSVSEQASKFTIHRFTGPYNKFHSQVFQLSRFQPSKVSAGLLTPPQTATMTISFDKEMDLLGGQRKGLDYSWLNIPERSHTKSTPAVFTNSNNINLHSIAADSILAFGDSVSENELTHSPICEEGDDDLLCQNEGNESLFSEPNDVSWENIDVGNNSNGNNNNGGQFAVGSEFFKVETPSLDMMFSVDNTDIAMISPDSDDVGKRKKDEVERTENQVNDMLMGDTDIMNNSEFQSLGGNFELTYGGNFL